MRILSISILLLGGCSDSLGSLTLHYDGTVSGTFRASSGEASPYVLGEGAQWPAEEDWAEGDDQFLTNFTRFRLGAQQAFTTELDVQDLRFNNGGTGTVLFHVDRIKWNNSARFPFVHEGRISGELEGLTLDGTFTVSEDNCTNTIINGDNIACGGYWPDVERGDVERTIVSWTEDDCPADVRALYVDGDVIEASTGRIDLGGKHTLSCVDIGTEANGGPYQCGDDSTVNVDGCEWAVTAFSSPENWFMLTAAIVDDACEEQTCRMQVGEVATP